MYLYPWLFFRKVSPLELSEQFPHIRGPRSLEDPCTQFCRSSFQQKAWDTPLVHGCFSSLIQNVEPREKARLLATHQKESGAWLSVPPVTTLGLRMDNDSIRVAIGIRLGVSLCEPHNCPNCSKLVDSSVIHGLDCRISKGRIPCHSGINAIIKRALSAANIPAILEPQGLSWSDEKRPDGLTIIPWVNSRSLVWDATCWDTFAPSYIHLSSSTAGSVADLAAAKKHRIYQELSHTHIFIPVAFETTGTFGKDALEFIHDLPVPRRSRLISKDPLEYLKLSQRISVCIQNSNYCASISVVLTFVMSDHCRAFSFFLLFFFFSEILCSFLFFPSPTMYTVTNYNKNLKNIIYSIYLCYNHNM